MTCQRVKRLLPLYLDHELAAKDATMVQEHLSVCAECRAALDQLRHDQHLLQSLPAVSPPDGWHQQLMQSIAAQKKRQRSRHFFVPRLSALAAVLLLVVLVSNLLVLPAFLNQEQVADESDHSSIVIQKMQAPESASEQNRTFAGQAMSMSALGAREAQTMKQARQWWLWSSFIAIGIWGIGVVYFYYVYRRQNK